MLFGVELSFAMINKRNPFGSGPIKQPTSAAIIALRPLMIFLDHDAENMKIRYAFFDDQTGKQLYISKDYQYIPH